MKLPLLLLSTLALVAQSVDLYPRRAAAFTTLPATCTVGETAFKSDAAAGQNWYGCTATNTWTQQAGGSGFVATISSSTVLAITAGISRINNVVTSTAASTATLSGSTASSTAYAYIDNAGVPTIGHNGAATISSANYTILTGVTDFPAGSQPLFEVTYVSNVWTTITNRLANTSQNVVVAGTGLLSIYNASGQQVISSSQSPISLKSYLPLGSVPDNGLNGTTAFSVNETRWLLITLPSASAFNTVGVYASGGIGASKGIRAAVATASGTITHKSNVQTICASSSICTMAFPSTVSLEAGQYYIGLTTDSTTFNSPQIKWPFQSLGQFMQTLTGASTVMMGTGTSGSGTSGTVDFGASMGSLTKWSTGSEAVQKLIEVFLDTN